MRYITKPAKNNKEINDKFLACKRSAVGIAQLFKHNNKKNLTRMAKALEVNRKGEIFNAEGIQPLTISSSSKTGSKVTSAQGVGVTAPTKRPEAVAKVDIPSANKIEIKEDSSPEISDVAFVQKDPIALKAKILNNNRERSNSRGKKK